MDTKFIILITSLLSGCTIQAPSYAPVLAVGSGAYKPPQAGELNSSDVFYSNSSTNVAPIKNAYIKTSFNQPLPSNIDKPLFVQPEEQPIMVARSPFTAATVAPALYPITRGKNLKVDTQNSAGNPSSYSLSGKKYNILPFSTGYKAKGIASWYGPDFHGKKTSNGEIYNMHGMTAAHKTLPIPSYVKVTNLKNNRTVVLRINDRGPYYEDRIIDLSYAAAQKLGVHERGTENVKVEAINSNSSIFLQLGVFDNPNNARKLQQKVAENSLPHPEIKQVLHEGRVVYKVQIGPLYNNTQVKSLNMKLASIGIAKTRYVTIK